jgi:Rap1a immunity proteins
MSYHIRANWTGYWFEGLGVSVLLLGYGGQARSDIPQFVIANYVKEICREQSADCSNYLLGVKEGIAVSQDWKVCFMNADTKQLRLAFLLYASQHPEEIAGPAAKMAAEAFAASFPCLGG